MLLTLLATIRRVGVQSDLVNSIPLARMTLFSCYGEVFVMAGMLTSLRRLKDGCWQALSSCFTRWTKPLGTSLPLATLTDLSRSKSELIAENALLRQQLIILRRQVKQPACTKTDRLLLVLLARVVRTWKQAHITRSARDAAARAAGALSSGLETQVKGLFTPTECSYGNDGLDQRDDEGQSTLKR